ncbi:hypothetical protein [Pelosinus sp. IPA-1]|uniref:hypothetical protein n=1 Tax=Pelosinus sp. IPA-1 TaxID=3029569 RepID=UPI0024361A2E|nr:hypothetical protein [Pelosinus sp. IPA-1]GMA99962.1 membrane protein [Pelosinus sp. IPA-1]
MLRTVSEIINYKTYYLRIACLVAVILLAVGIVAKLPAIPQDISYHNFSDVDRRWGIENGSNVISNISFIIAGIVGLIRTRHWPWSKMTFMWRFFFCSITFVGFGSAYYHLQPSNSTLFWDRLPMTLGFATLTACICAERFGLRVGGFVFVPLVLSGVCSVFYWLITELAGAGDLRLYILVQYLPMIIVPLILILFPKKSTGDRYYWILLSSYIIAKGFEMQDYHIFEMTHHVISGHTLKHLIAGLGILLFRADKIEKETV